MLIAAIAGLVEPRSNAGYEVSGGVLEGSLSDLILSIDFLRREKVEREWVNGGLEDAALCGFEDEPESGVAVPVKLRVVDDGERAEAERKEAERRMLAEISLTEEDRLCRDEAERCERRGGEKSDLPFLVLFEGTRKVDCGRGAAVVDAGCESAALLCLMEEKRVNMPLLSPAPALAWVVGMPALTDSTAAADAKRWKGWNVRGC